MQYSARDPDIFKGGNLMNASPFAFHILTTKNDQPQLCGVRSRPSKIHCSISLNITIL